MFNQAPYISGYHRCQQTATWNSRYPVLYYPSQQRRYIGADEPQYLNIEDLAIQFSGNDVYAKRPTKVYAHDLTSVAYTTPSGQRVGQIYSYILRNGGIWWMLEDEGTGVNYVPHSEALVLAQPTPEQLSTWESITQAVSNTAGSVADGASSFLAPTTFVAKWGLPILAGFVIWDKFFR